MLKRLIFHFLILFILINHSSCAQYNKNQSGSTNSDQPNTNTSTQDEKKKKEENNKIKNPRIANPTLDSEPDPETAPTTTDESIDDYADGVSELADELFSLQKDVDFTVELLSSMKLESRDATTKLDQKLSKPNRKNERENALPPVREVKVRLHIKNRQSFPMWYIIPTYGETTLPEAGHFETAEHKLEEAFSGKVYEGYVGEDSVGKVVELAFNGSYQSAFKAFYLPSGASITFRNYAISSWEQLSSFELWGAKHLLVNGKQPLQEWMPYQLLSDGNLVVHCAANEPCAFREISEGIRSVTPKNKVSFVQAKTFKKHTVTLK